MEPTEPRNPDRISLENGRGSMRRIDSVSTERPYTLLVKWRDGRVDRVDMSGVINTKELFRGLKEYSVFDTAKVVAHGSGIEWRNGLDYSADSLEVMGEQQRSMSGEDFANWMKDMNISLQEAAD